MGQRVLRRLLSSSGFHHHWGILAGGEKERQRPHGYHHVQRLLHVALRPVLLFHLKGETERRERLPTSKDSLISEVHRSKNLKEDLKKLLKREHKGHTVRDIGR